MQTVQLPSVAGMFYPADPDSLSHTVEQLLDDAKNPGTRPKALIAPHAGYIYSGPIAASAYVLLESLNGQINQVVAFAPAHRVPFAGIAAATASYFRTPLGDVPVDRAAVDKALKLPQVKAFDAVFEGEHALEVQLPFLQKTLRRFNLAPFIVGDASGEEVAEVIDHLWGDDSTLIVISSDLSHYLEYTSAKSIDSVTTDAIESLAPQLLHHDNACGRIPIQGMLIAAREHGLRVETLDTRNSGDTAGSKDRVVGYGAYAFH